MYQTPDQLVALNKANLETAIKFAGVALQGAERLLDVQLKAARSALSESVESAKAIASAKDLQQLAALNTTLAQPSIEKATAYAKSVYDVTAATQAEFGRLVEEQVSEFNKQVVTALDRMVKTAPAGSEVGIAAFKSGISAVNSAYDNMSKIAKQFADTTRSNVEVAARQAANGSKKARKA
jgi:phasin family protein